MTAREAGVGRTRHLVRELYFGSSRRAALFQYGLLAFDIATIAFFIVVSFIEQHDWLVTVDLVLALVLAIELAARLWVDPAPRRRLLSTTADAVVIVSLLLPAFTESYAFLRMLRAVRLIRSYRVLGLLCRHSRWASSHEEVLLSALNLAVFLFMATAVVYVTQARINPAVHDYVDALYFTVTAMTTTGFGDITLPGTAGKLLSVVIMLAGISLFLRLVQTIFRPSKVRHECPVCGLLRHDSDSIHCKHCGTVLHIRTEGEG